MVWGGSPSGCRKQNGYRLRLRLRKSNIKRTHPHTDAHAHTRRSLHAKHTATSSVPSSTGACTKSIDPSTQHLRLLGRSLKVLAGWLLACSNVGEACELDLQLLLSRCHPSHPPSHPTTTQAHKQAFAVARVNGRRSLGGPSVAWCFTCQWTGGEVKTTEGLC